MPDALFVRVNDTRLALPLSGEQTISELGPVAPLPHGEPLLLGLTTVQGRAVPLLDIAPLLGERSAGRAPLMVLTSLEGERVALLVHEVYGVSSVPTPPPGTSLLLDVPGGKVLNAASLARELRDHLTP
ncbi:chemotaxis protein CheW [Deinococcus taeanensis]|uniref:chemotaxis protein CheW n=1 Tax=Deinococcus taeanensis TaxID=2737050 RepID=UPI001CDC3DC9|nr:chemotaxis protein CheW [Deinococcus taeanensis]UBV42080.1 chemotaxis protein CheW [Deinococcus taeanensis]